MQIKLLDMATGSFVHIGGEPHSPQADKPIGPCTLLSIGSDFKDLEIKRSGSPTRPYRAILTTTDGNKFSIDICEDAFAAIREHFMDEDAEPAPEPETEIKYAFRVAEARTERLTSWVGERFFGGASRHAGSTGIIGKPEISEAKLYDSPSEAYADVAELPDTSHFFEYFNWELVEVEVATHPDGQVTYSYD